MPQIVLYDRQTGSNCLITVNQVGLASNNRSQAPMFSPDGSMGMFSSWASDLTSGDFNHAGDVYTFPLLYLALLPDNEGHGVWLSWPWESSKTYSPQYKAGLDGTMWQNLPVPVTNNGIKAYLHDIKPATGQRLYRVIAF